MNHSTTWAHNIADAFVRRGISLNAPATDRALAELAHSFGGVDPTILSIYAVFDGFVPADFDALSELRVWTIDEVISEARSVATTDPSHVRFADFSMHADVYCSDWVLPSRPVVSAFSGKHISSSWTLFWSELTTGVLDRPS